MDRQCKTCLLPSASKVSLGQPLFDIDNQILSLLWSLSTAIPSWPITSGYGFAQFIVNSLLSLVSCFCSIAFETRLETVLASVAFEDRLGGSIPLRLSIWQAGRLAQCGRILELLFSSAEELII